MKKGNTMILPEYLLNHIFYPLIAMMWYRSFVFIALPQVSVAWSKMILWALVMGMTLMGWLYTAKKRRNRISLAVNTILPYEVYTVLAYHIYLPWLVWTSVAVGGILVVIFSGVVMLSPVRKESKRKVILQGRAKKAFLGSRVIMTVCLLFLPFFIGFRMFFGHGLLDTKVASVPVIEQDDEWTIKNNIDVVRLLVEEEWEQLSDQEKLDVLGVVTNIEIRYLGINHELYVKSAVLNGEVAAHYNHKDHEIVIDMEHLRTAAAAEVLKSLCHECYHSYQHQMVDLYNSAGDEYKNMLLFQYVPDYIKEFEDYNDGSENIWDYYSQTTESMARKYSSEAVLDYYGQIVEYTSEQ